MASRCVCEVLGSLELRAAVFCGSFAFPKAGKELNSKKWLAYFSQGSGAWAEGWLSPLGRTWTSTAHDEFDPDDSVVGNNVLRKAFRKPFV